jgi:DNA polymerase/3'-5' exonuclease PolX
MLLEDALPIAKKCLTDLMPYCERAEIAGSIRRQKPEVKDFFAFLEIPMPAPSERTMPQPK